MVELANFSIKCLPTGKEQNDDGNHAMYYGNHVNAGTVRPRKHDLLMKRTMKGNPYQLLHTADLKKHRYRFWNNKPFGRREWLNTIQQQIANESDSFRIITGNAATSSGH